MMKQLEIIIVVDDDNDFLDIVKTIVVQAFGANSTANIQSFNDPVKAINFLKNQPRNFASLLITDINMKFPGDLLGRTVGFSHPEMDIIYYSSGERPHTFISQQTFLSKTSLYLTLKDYLLAHFTI
jgi:two-component SAPR family response regulator